MKAITCTSYGTPDVLQITEVEKPTPGDNEVLIRIHATSAGPADCAFRQGDPFLLRLMNGLRRPRMIPGTELAGVVEVVGSRVTRFKQGDPVFAAAGTSYGAYAEYKVLPEDGVVALKPANMTLEEAAGITDGGLTALAFLKDHANLRPGQTILINGASGSVGVAAVQIARHLGAEVTGVCSTTNIALVLSLGADRVIDYTHEDFTRTGETYDVIFDAVGKSSFSRCRGALKDRGIYLTTVPTLDIFVQMARTARGGKKARFAATGLNQRQENLSALRELIEAGALRTVIDRCYPLEQIAEAHRYVETGHKKGSVVITVADSRRPQHPFVGSPAS